MLSALRVERDRLADERDGLSIALDVSCVSGSLGLLLPGVGLVIALAARAACALGDLAEVQSRIDALSSILDGLERLASGIADADPTDTKRMQAFDAAVSRVVAAVSDVSAVDDLVELSASTAQDVIDDASTALKLSVGGGLLAAAVVAVVAAVAWLR